MYIFISLFDVVLYFASLVFVIATIAALFVVLYFAVIIIASILSEFIG